METSDEEKKRATQMILKAETEKILCDSAGDNLMGLVGYEVVANLMCLSLHDFSRYTGQVLGQFELEFDAPRPEGWRNFADKVSKLRFEDGKYFNLSAKARGLRDAALAIAILADCFEYIEKSELKEKRNEN